jgi:hypothetical protein
MTNPTPKGLPMPFDLKNLHSAFIVTCERVLRERDDTTSIIRIVDLYDVPESIATQSATIQINALTIMRSRVRSDGHAFSMEIGFPDGSARTVLAIDGDKPLVVAFGSKAPETSLLFGAQVLIQVNLNTSIAGPYVLRALIDEKLIAETAITLRVRRNA